MIVRTRFAPSPTGSLHLGNARTAILNWLVARHYGGQFILRLEDTDLERHVEGAESATLESLDWLGLDRDEGPVAGGPHGPYRQSERLELYRERVEWLLERGLAYHCYCSPSELAARRATALAAGRPIEYDGRCRKLTEAAREAYRAEGRSPTVRFRVEPGPVRFEDTISGPVVIDGADFGDIIILRSDGRPTYNLAVVVDDIDMQISHVIRGIGHLSNTPKQVLLYRAFGAETPVFVHHPMLLAPGGGKLSKREGATGVLDYRNRGFHPHAVLNYLSLMAWSTESGEEFLRPEDLVQQIDLDRLGASNAILDEEKMRWLSGRHIRADSVASLAARLRDFVDGERFGLSDRDYAALAEILQPRILLLREATEDAEQLYVAPPLRGDTVRTVLGEPTATAALGAARGAWGSVEWSRDALREGLKAAATAAEVKGRWLFQPVRVALTGRTKGPELPDVAYMLGADRTLERLDVAIAHATGEAAADG
jgi:glutamyl-tRNA synthetase